MKKEHHEGHEEHEEHEGKSNRWFFFVSFVVRFFFLCRIVVTRAIVLHLCLGIGVVLLGGKALHAQDGPPLTGPETEKRFPPLQVPEGFEVTLFACDPLVEYPSVIARGERVGSLFVAYDYMTGLGTKIVRRDEIRRVEDTDGDGYADTSRLFSGGLNSVMGLAFDGETVFVMHAPYLTALRDTDGDGVADERRDLITGLGLRPEENSVRLHAANGMAIGHDGWLYLALGDHGCDVLRPEGDRLVYQGGGILRCRADGRDLHVFSTGLRNIYDVALDEELNVFVRDNENDGGDYKNRVYHSVFGADHGYPYLYYERPDEALAPLADVGLGSSAGGACYRETAFPPEYRGNLFFCEWGRSVVRYRRERAGSTFQPMTEIEFAVGAKNDPYGFKPTDLVVDHDGSLLVADWADGQRPKRGRGRIYRIRYGAGATALVSRTGSSDPSFDELFRRLDAESYLARAEAQRLVMDRGPAGRVALVSRIRAGELGVRGRLHAIWALAGWGGDEARGELFSLAENDPDGRVRAGAVRALTDLSDPVFLAKRLEAGPGDTRVIRRLLPLLDDADARVRLESITALGRLRWAGAPERLRSATRGLDPALAHAVLQTLRRSGNWSAVLALVDQRPIGQATSPLRGIALAAISGVADAVIVNGLIHRLADPSPSRRIEYADALTRLYKKPGPWVYWGYRPPARPAGTEAWERTPAIAAALDRVLADSDRAVRASTLGRMRREKVPALLATLTAWLEIERDEQRVGAILDALRGRPAASVRETLVRVVLDGTHATVHRLAALKMLTRSTDEATTKRLVEITRVVEDGAVMAAALRQFTDRPERVGLPLLGRKLRSPDPSVRAVAIELVAARDAIEEGARVRRMLDDDDPRVRRAAALALGRLGVREAIVPLLALATNEDLALRRASLESLGRFGERRALPLAARALEVRETRRAALDVLAALGGPEYADAIVEVAEKDRSSETLLRVVRILTRWQEKEPRSSPLHLSLERAVQRVQGSSGVLVRWMATGPLTPEAASELSDALRRAADVPDATTVKWRRAFGASLASEVRLVSTHRSAGGGVWLAYCDVWLDEPTDVQFLGASNGTLRVWAGERRLHERAAGGDFRPDSDRFEAKLDAGTHRILLETRVEGDVRFHLRFREMSSTPERERLARLVLQRDGNVRRGRVVFRDAEKTRCITCHRLGSEGGKVGPDLTGVGSRFSRAYLIESILEPGRTIAPSFDTRVVVLEDGQVVTGVNVAETETTLTLADAQGESHTVQKSHIIERKIQAGSIMPEGLETQLSDRELIDLVAFLLAQKEER